MSHYLQVSCSLQIPNIQNLIGSFCVSPSQCDDGRRAGGEREQREVSTSWLYLDKSSLKK